MWCAHDAGLCHFRAESVWRRGIREKFMVEVALLSPEKQIGLWHAGQEDPLGKWVGGDEKSTERGKQGALVTSKSDPI